MAKKDDEKQPIIIKRIKKSGGGHHGGAWKVAYADFVTAMMAFFLLLWLLNVTTAEQKDLISSYFAPTDPRVANSQSGSGGVMGGKTMSPQGAMTSDRSAVAADAPGDEGKEGEDNMNTAENEGGAQGQTDGQGEGEGNEMSAEAKSELDQKDEAAFQATEEKIKQAVESIPELKDIQQNLLIDMTPEGLRIQIVDQEGKPMFESGSAKPLPQTERLLRLIRQVVIPLPNKLSIRGHTDSTPFGKSNTYTNWELSADRANASRRIMLANSLSSQTLDPSRIENVQGKADNEPLLPNDPTSPRNRRVSLILLKQSIAPPAGTKPSATIKPSATPTRNVDTPVKPEPKKREEGVIYFP